MRIVRWVAVALGVGLVLILALWLGRFAILTLLLRSAGAHARAVYLGQPVDASIRERLPLIEADRAELSRVPVFRPSAGKRDAGPFLNAKLRWEGDVPAEAHEPKPLDLPTELTQALAMQNDWLAWKVDWPRWKLDFSWMAQLSQFDVWSIDANSPAIDARKQYRSSSHPIPRLVDLITWSKLRLLKAKEAGDVEPALAEVQQLARLVWTNDALISAMVAIALLRVGTTFATSRVPPVGGTVAGGQVPLATLDKARRYFWAIALGPDPRLSDEVWQRLVQEPGLCLAVNDNTVTTYSVFVRALLGADLAAPLQRFSDLVDRTAAVCRPSWAREVWRDPSYPLLFREDEDMFAQALMDEKPPPPKPGPFALRWSELQAHPELARTFGYLLMSVAAPDPLRQYDRAAADGGVP